MSATIAVPMITVFIIGYLLGSIPFGLVLTRLAGLGDLRAIGSGNIGATNVLRTGSKTLAALTLLLDALKGTLAVVIAALALPGLAGMVADGGATIPFFTRTGEAGLWVAGLGAFLGHLYPVWLGFKGGKGVATYIGVLLGAMPYAALAFCGTWIAVALATRYSSLAALVATLVTFLVLATTGGPFVIPVVAVMSALLYWRHRENIRRLAQGRESRIGDKS